MRQSLVETLEIMSKIYFQFEKKASQMYTTLTIAILEILLVVLLLRIYVIYRVNAQKVSSLRSTTIKIKKAGRFEKLLGIARSPSIVTIGSVSLSCAITQHLSRFSESYRCIQIHNMVNILAKVALFNLVQHNYRGFSVHIGTKCFNRIHHTVKVENF